MKITNKKILDLFYKVVFLIPSLLWSHILYLRRQFYEIDLLKQTQLNIPVISIGNITMGGTGKTPFAIWLSRYLISKGLNPVILMRGYKGKLEKKGGLLKAQEKFKLNPNEYGDEAILLARSLTKGAIIVGKNRSFNFNKYFSQINSDIAILDDGFQHVRLRRNLDILIIDATTLINHYQFPPLGVLREGLFNLKKAQVVIINKADLISPFELQSLVAFISNYISSETKLVYSRYTHHQIVNMLSNEKVSFKDFPYKQVLAVSGLGNPESFYKTLQTLGFAVVESFTFADHHSYSKDELSSIEKLAFEMKLPIVSTEKDIVKIKTLSIDKNWYYLPLEIEFLSGQEELIAQLEKVLHLELLDS